MTIDHADIDLDAVSFEQVWQEKQWRMCAPQTDDPDKLMQGFMYFCEHFWFIRHPERGRIQIGRAHV